MGGGEANKTDFIKKIKVSTKLQFGTFILSDTGTSYLAGPSEELACIFGEMECQTRSDGQVFEMSETVCEACPVSQRWTCEGNQIHTS